MRKLGTIIISILVMLCSSPPARTAGPYQVPNPTVIGPIPAQEAPGNPSHKYPFFSATADLANQGYVEEEFFLEGIANRYVISNALATGTVLDGGHQYRTRMIVRRPASQGKFNGIVLVEWLNVSAGYDLDGLWLQSQEHLTRRGYAWIGISVQRLGIHQPVTGLKAWSPGRYGTLDLTDGGTITDDGLCYDIFSQAIQSVRAPKGVSPMGGLRIQQVFAFGASQSADRLVIYHNSIHPRAGVVDAFIIALGGGQLRTDLGVKAFKLLTETDIAYNQAALRQPDSDHFRRWEIAGSSHFDLHIAQERDRLRARDLPASPSPSCDRPPFSRIPAYFGLNAALDKMVAWVKSGAAPPSGSDIELATPRQTVLIARDTNGNALGGIRLSQHAVPVAVNTGVNSGPGFCRLYGSFLPFDNATLDALYPDHALYVSQVSRVTSDNLRKGFIVKEDADATIREAERSGIGKH